jgi:hypothetical protein
MAFLVRGLDQKKSDRVLDSRPVKVGDFPETPRLGHEVKANLMLAKSRILQLVSVPHYHKTDEIPTHLSVVAANHECAQLTDQVHRTSPTLAISVLALVAIFANTIFLALADYTTAIDFLHLPANIPMEQNPAGLGKFVVTAANLVAAVLLLLFRAAGEALAVALPERNQSLKVVKPAPSNVSIEPVAKSKTQYLPLNPEKIPIKAFDSELLVAL